MLLPRCNLSFFLICAIQFTWTATATTTTSVMESSPERVLFSIHSDPDVVLQGEWWSSPLCRASSSTRPLFLFVHQYTVMGGSRKLMAGMARHATAAGYEAVTFDLRGAGDSSGSCTYRNKSERADVLAMLRHVESSSSRPVFLVGSSAGAALAGSVLESSSRVLGGLFVGYTWGWGASMLFGWAFESIQASSKHKLFVVGTADEFTSMRQYEERVGALGGGREVNEVVVLQGKNHFQIEAAEYDKFVVEKAVAMVDKIASLAKAEAEAECSDQSSHQKHHI